MDISPNLKTLSRIYLSLWVYVITAMPPDHVSMGHHMSLRRQSFKYVSIFHGIFRRESDLHIRSKGK
jgi:hypothetical protein